MCYEEELGYENGSSIMIKNQVLNVMTVKLVWSYQNLEKRETSSDARWVLAVKYGSLKNFCTV
jgi:hypothetical protein